MNETPRRAAPRFAISRRSDRPFDADLERLFRDHHHRVFGYINRLCGEPDLAADIAQETFVRLHQRGSLPPLAVPWLITVATNLLRNARTRSARRRALLEEAGAASVTESPRDAVTLGEDRDRVRAALARLGTRDQQLLSLLAGGYRYREIAAALGLHAASVGTLLARAKSAFRTEYGAADDSP